LAGYKIYRALQAGLPYWEKLGSIDIPDTCYSDLTVKTDNVYWYAVSAYDSSYPNNESQRSSMVCVAINYTGITADVEDISCWPKESRISQNSPNPFSQTTIIRYQLSKAGQVNLNVYNIQGQLVKTLAEGFQIPGEYSAKWDRRDNHGKQVSAGVYIYHLVTGDRILNRKMVVLK